MDVQIAVENFVTAMHHCDNHVQIHRGPDAKGRGRRGPETSLNRGVIVLAVASWQAFVQDLALALRDATHSQVIAAGNASALVTSAMQAWRAEIANAVGNFSTPNKTKTVGLLGKVGFNPIPSWTWKQLGGRGKTSVVVESHHVAEVLDEWLKVRHAVAHGQSTLDPLPILAAVRDPKASKNLKEAPSLRLDDAIDCMRFFRSVVRVTAAAAAKYIAQPAPIRPQIPPLALGVHISALLKSAGTP